MNRTKALLFDFDGLIMDTETAAYQSWVDVYRSHGVSMPLEMWVAGIGTLGEFDPFEYLQRLVARPLDRASVRKRQQMHHAELMHGKPVLPGVSDYIAAARHLGMKVGIASSSPLSWVERLLHGVGMASLFDVIRCRDHVAAVKPDPQVYLEALRALQVAAGNAVAFEDSPNGLLAAKRAGLFCVVVPNDMTRGLPFADPDYQVASLASMPLTELLALIEKTTGRHH